MRVVRPLGVVVVHIVYKINIIHLTVILLEQNNDHYLILCSGRETTKQNIREEKNNFDDVDVDIYADININNNIKMK